MKYKSRLTLIGFLAWGLCSWLVACKPRVPEQFLQPDELEDILFDYHVAQAMAQQEELTPNDDTHGQGDQRDYHRTLYFAAVLKKHGVTREQFDSTMLYYYTRADRLEPIYQRVTKRLEEEAVKYGASEGELNRYAVLSEGGDTTNVWEGNRNAVLLPYPPYNRMGFVQAADSTFKPGDNMIFSFMAKFLYQTGTHEAVVCLVAKLDNDSVLNRLVHITVDGRCQVRVNLPTNRTVKQLSGFVYLNKGSESSSTLKLMFLNNLQLLRLHTRSGENEAVKPTKPEPVVGVVDTQLKAADSLGVPTPPDSMLRPVRLEEKLSK